MARPRKDAVLRLDYNGLGDILTAGIPMWGTRKPRAKRVPKEAVASEMADNAPVRDAKTPRIDRRVKEKVIEAYLVKEVEKAGGEAFKVQFIGRRACPDRLVMFPDRPCVWVEVKAPGEKPRADQQRMHTRMRALGQTVEVVDTLDVADALIAGLI